MKLYTLRQLAEALGVSYKVVHNRLEIETGKIVIGGKLIQANRTKTRGEWYIWCDLGNLPDAAPPQAPPLRPKVSTTKGKGKQMFFIDPSKSGRG